MKAKISLVIRCREERVNWKKAEDRESLFFKALAIDFGLHRKVVHGSAKLVMADFLSNGLHEKVMICC